MTISQHTKNKFFGSEKHHPSEISSTNFSFAGCRYSVLSLASYAHIIMLMLWEKYISLSFVSFLSLVLISILFRRVLKTASGAVRKCGGRMQIFVSPWDCANPGSIFISTWTLSKPQAMSSMSSSQTESTKICCLSFPCQAYIGRPPFVALHF